MAVEKEESVISHKNQVAAAQFVDFSFPK